jgi:lipoprotein-anchoring transpeptidase ErfK/SrfK
MLRKIILSLFLAVYSIGCCQTIPIDLYQTLKKLHYRPTSSILVVSIDKQTLYLFKEGSLLKSYLIATAKNGIGQEEGSEKTPIGLHVIGSMYGKSADPFTVFRSRKDTGKIWKPGTYVGEDLVLTRVLCLEGLEEGLNQGLDSKGCNVDSAKRYIYIHGTNHESDLGHPSSKGCIRMANFDVIELFDQVKEGSLVWIAP